VKKKATVLEYERSYKRLILLTRCMSWQGITQCPLMLAIFTSIHPGKRRDSALNTTCHGTFTVCRLRLILQKQRYDMLLDTFAAVPVRVRIPYC